MLDIDFYMKSHETFNYESIRNPTPVVYNIETTNACNMRCTMCPRTTMMTRPVETMGFDLFEKVVSQLKPHPKELWEKWEKWVLETYGIPKTDMSENHFFLYVIPKVIQLHGYGEPLLDRNIGRCVKLLNEKGFESYFSCNPANIDVGKTIDMFDKGLGYIKYSIESVDDETHKEIRGKESNFTDAYRKILRVLEIKKEHNLKTVVVITMLDLNRKEQGKEYFRLKEMFEGQDVYIYFKSQDTQWLSKNYHGTNSIHWLEPCRHPWMSMTIKSNGEATQCMEDFNNAIVLGNAKHESLYDIWNGRKYDKLRRDHITLTPGTQCTERCDMMLAGDSIEFQR